MTYHVLNEIHVICALLLVEAVGLGPTVSGSCCFKSHDFKV